MTTAFEQLKQIIEARHTTKPAAMNGTILPREQIMQLLELADRAPTHARTEPWRFIVYTGESLRQFCNDHAQLYWEHTPEDKRTQSKFESIRDQYKTVSHLVVTYMRRTPMAKIPASEEYAAASAAVENILLGCEALNIAAIWSTGGMTHHPAMKQYLQMAEEDVIIALLMLGKSDEAKPPTPRNIPLSEKVVFK